MASVFIFAVAIAIIAIAIFGSLVFFSKGKKYSTKPFVPRYPSSRVRTCLQESSEEEDFLHHEEPVYRSKASRRPKLNISKIRSAIKDRTHVMTKNLSITDKKTQRLIYKGKAKKRSQIRIRRMPKDFVELRDY